LIDLKHFRL